MSHQGNIMKRQKKENLVGAKDRVEKHCFKALCAKERSMSANQTVMCCQSIGRRSDLIELVLLRVQCHS